MKLLGWHKYKFKILGLTIFKIQIKDLYIVYKVFNIPVFFKRLSSNFWLDLQGRYSKTSKFDNHDLDQEIYDHVPVFEKKEDVHLNRIAFIATVLYDMGGHTKLFTSMGEVLSKTYQEKLFLVNKDTSYKNAPKSMLEIQKFCDVDGVNTNSMYMEECMKRLFHKITKFAPKVIFAFIHPDDVVGAGVLALLKKYSNTKIIYIPHASHVPAMAGVSYSDIVLEGLKTTAYMMKNIRKVDHICFQPGMIAKAKEDFPSFSDEQVKNMRTDLGIPDGYKCTMSGASAYKFFDLSNQDSEYFRMIKILLEKNEKLIHIIFLNGYSEVYQKIFDEIFDNGLVKSRVLIYPTRNDYELCFKCADVFIDSFPVASSLCMIDLMRLKVPYVVKINSENAMYSFHEWQRDDFKYMYKTSKEMLQGIEKLLNEKDQKNIDDNYDHYMKNFEASAWKENLSFVIEHSDDLESIMVKDNFFDDLNYKFMC